MFGSYQKGFFSWNVISYKCTGWPKIQQLLRPQFQKLTFCLRQGPAVPALLPRVTGLSICLDEARWAGASEWSRVRDDECNSHSLGTMDYEHKDGKSFSSNLVLGHHTVCTSWIPHLEDIYYTEAHPLTLAADSRGQFWTTNFWC
jgi:hypothetical protein